MATPAHALARQVDACDAHRVAVIRAQLSAPVHATWCMARGWCKLPSLPAHVVDPHPPVHDVLRCTWAVVWRWRCMPCWAEHHTAHPPLLSMTPQIQILERLPFHQALYLTITTLSTVGFGGVCGGCAAMRSGRRQGGTYELDTERRGAFLPWTVCAPHGVGEAGFASTLRITPSPNPVNLTPRLSCLLQMWCRTRLRGR